MLRGDPAGPVLATLMPDEPEVDGLLALVMLTEFALPRVRGWTGTNGLGMVIVSQAASWVWSGVGGR